jgi:hypothetical protein
MRKHFCQCSVAGFFRLPPMILKARERQAQPAHDLRQLTFGIFVISEVERRPCGELIENRL